MTNIFRLIINHHAQKNPVLSDYITTNVIVCYQLSDNDGKRNVHCY